MISDLVKRPQTQLYPVFLYLNCILLAILLTSMQDLDKQPSNIQWLSNSANKSPGHKYNTNSQLRYLAIQRLNF
jgi:hypothetical protein